MILATATARLIKPIVVAVLLLCVCMAVLVLLSSSSAIEFRRLLQNPLLVPAIILQVGATYLFVLAWQSILELCPPIRFSFAECTAHIGVTLLGKYLPGKIWGLLGRSFLLTKRGQSPADAMNLLLADQFVTFYTGIMLGAVALSAFYSPAIGLTLAIVFVVTLKMGLNHYAGIMTWAAKKIGALYRRLPLQADNPQLVFDQSQFMKAALVYIAHWLSTSTVLCLLFYPSIAADLLPGVLLITAALPLAVLFGFIVVWAPGGVGVREGTIVAILILHLPLELAVTIAICYRMICILNDISTGVFSVFYLLKVKPSLLPAGES